MAWTGQSFSVGQILTAAQMTNLQSDITAVMDKAPGAPVLANNYVVTGMYAVGSVNTTALSDNSVTSSKISPKSVIESKIGVSAVTQTKIASNSVGTSEIINSNVTEEKLETAVFARLVTNGDSHNHIGGDGGTIALSSLSGTSELAAASIASTDYHYMIRGSGSSSEIGNRAVYISSVVSSTYIKRIELVSPVSGSYRTRIGLDRTAGTAYGRVYVNGVGVGLERSSTTNGYLYWDENITVSAGDLIQIYVRQTAGGPGYSQGASASIQVGSLSGYALILIASKLSIANESLEIA